MSSFTSSSDPFRADTMPADIAAWRTFVVRVTVLAIAFSVALLAIFAVLDPYDTGQLALVHKQGTTESNPQTGDASRIHDEAYDSAIIGNSHIMSLVASRLSAATGLNFVMLGIQGTGVPEQMTLLDAYLRRHSPPKALVIGVDWVYCLADPHVHPILTFPDWLYSSSRWSYLKGLFQTRTFEVLGRRIRYLIGRREAQVRDGTIDIFEGHRRTPEQAAKLIRDLPREDFESESAMPAFQMLADQLDHVPTQTAVVLVLPPVAAAWLPLPGSPADASVQACKRRAFDLARGRPNVRVVDWHKATPETETVGNFWDPSHYYDGLARRVEMDIAHELAAMGAAPAMRPAATVGKGS